MNTIFQKDENKLMVMETGYRGIMNSITSKQALIEVMRDFFGVIKIIPEIEQFASGLESLFNLKDYSEQLKQVFVYRNEETIAKGIYMSGHYSSYSPWHHLILVKVWRQVQYRKYT